MRYVTVWNMPPPVCREFIFCVLCMHLRTIVSEILKLALQLSVFSHSCPSFFFGGALGRPEVGQPLCVAWAGGGVVVCFCCVLVGLLSTCSPPFHNMVVLPKVNTPCRKRLLFRCTPFKHPPNRSKPPASPFSYPTALLPFPCGIRRGNP